VARFTSDSKEQFGGVSGVTITTFTMVAFSGKRSEESEKVRVRARARARARVRVRVRVRVGVTKWPLAASAARSWRWWAGWHIASEWLQEGECLQKSRQAAILLASSWEGRRLCWRHCRAKCGACRVGIPRGAARSVPLDRLPSLPCHARR